MDLTSTKGATLVVVASVAVDPIHPATDLRAMRHGQLKPLAPDDASGRSVDACLSGLAERDGSTLYHVQPGATGPTRLRAMLPLMPLLLPPVKLKLKVAAVQL